MPEFDRYDDALLDSQEYDDISESDRRAAEAEMRRRDRAAGIHRNERDLVYDDEDDDDDIPRHKRRAAEKAAEIQDMDTEENIESIECLEDTKGHTIKEWVLMLGPRTEISNRFKNFLRTCIDAKGQYVYRDKIRRMCEQNLSSFVVSFTHLAINSQVIASFLLEAPFQIFEIFDKVAKDMVLGIYPTYERVTTEIHVRIDDIPVLEELRTFRKIHLNQLVRTQGVVTATTGVLPQLSVVKYDCVKCGFILGPFVQNQNSEVKPGSCPECQSTGPFSVSFFKNIYCLNRIL